MSYSDSYDPKDGIAIVGMAGRFPGARTPHDLWHNLLLGRETITHFQPDELEAAGVDEMALRNDPAYVRARGILEDVDKFDAAFFGFTPKEAEVLDPQQRLFLEAAWEALEDAGHDPRSFHGPIGVFAGSSNNSYFLNNLLGRKDVTEIVGWLTTMMGNEKDYLATRVAYKLDLKGPALNILTACSTSLVAVCSAVQSLAAYQCDMALAGGVSVTLPQRRGYLAREGAITSPDGHCRAFDQHAAGTVFSNGLGIVVLRRLADAVASGDNIYAVVKGAALNNDGNAKVSFTAPSVEGHAQVIAMAQAQAGIDPATISYVEAHGTGTSLGDPIEIAGLTQAFRVGGAFRKRTCALGALKTNIGHLDAAAGVAGLIKTALALHHRTLPATLHFEAPNPKLDLDNTPFFVNTQCRPWETDGQPLRAGVSSFGVGGTNAHVVLEEAPVVEFPDPARPTHLLVLSARTPAALEEQSQRLATRLAEEPELDIADAAYTLQTGRRAFEHRLAFTCQDRASALETLSNRPKQKSLARSAQGCEGVAFMFPGQGAQYVGMGRELYDSEPLFRSEVDESCELLAPLLGRDLRRILYPAAEHRESAQTELTQTAVTQPALFVIEFALARLWMSWGVHPAAMIGHSLGEYVAATIGGTFHRDDALVLLARRAALMQTLPSGRMLAVKAPAARLAEYLSGDLSIAAYNSPGLVVVSGGHAALEELEKKLTGLSIVCRQLQTSHAFHSSTMDPILGNYQELVRAVRPRAPRQRWIAGLTGVWITDAEACNPAYWARQMREAVRFSDGVGQLLDGSFALLEVGPGRTLATLARQHGSCKPSQQVVATLPADGNKAAELDSALQALGQLWSAGCAIDWKAFNEWHRRRRISLPTYPFERTRYWVDPPPLESPQTKGWGHVVSATPPIPEHRRQSNDRIEQPPVETGAPLTGNEVLRGGLRQMFSELSGLEPSRLDAEISFFELGLDSLVLTQASAALNKRFGVTIKFRELLEDCATIAALADRIGQLKPQSAFPPAPSPMQPAPAVIEKIKHSSLATQRNPQQAQGFGPYRPPVKGVGAAFTADQQRNLNYFCERYSRRTRKSKELTEQHRPHLADPRSVAGFRSSWKEIVYPIVTERSEGSRLWDIDGNQYVDLVNGFGAIFFGHNPEFVRAALEVQLEAGIEIGPQSPIAGQTAARICEMVGMQRAAFCNTGSEAVTAAIRTARTVTGRDKIAMFAGAYHGIFDEVLVRARVKDGLPGAQPIAPGIPAAMADNVMVLEYGNPAALDVIRAYGDELAAVLVEPVQSRRPDLQPREFLHELRQITAKSGTALVFDEVVTGFRVHPGGMQVVFGVKADIATYGKVLGGGLAIGIIAGDARFLDALDGGMWRFGDSSVPEVGVTFFAGTFVRHPLALAAASAVLERLRQGGSEVQRGLNRRTSAFVACLNAIARAAKVPVRAKHFASWFMIDLPAEAPLASLFFAYMRDHGIHIWEGRPGFLTLAHSDADLDRVYEAFRRTLEEMQSADFLPRMEEVDPLVGDRQRQLPLTPQQIEVWVESQMGREASCAFNQCFVLHLRGPLSVPSMANALNVVIGRHPALRTTFNEDATAQRILPALEATIPVRDLAELTPTERQAAFDKIVEEETGQPFDLAKGPLLRVRFVRESEELHRLVLTVHHIVCDGWSSSVLFSDLARAYASDRFGLLANLPTSMSYETYVEGEVGRTDTAADESFWLRQFADSVPILHLPCDRKRPMVRTRTGARQTLAIDATLYEQIKAVGAKNGATQFHTLLAAFEILMFRLSGQTDMVVGMPIAGQIQLDNNHLVAHCVSTLPLRCRIAPDAGFASFLKHVRTCVLDAQSHPNITFSRLLPNLKLDRDPSSPALVSIVFNVDKLGAKFDFGDLVLERVETPKRFVTFDLMANVVDSGTCLVIEFDYNTDLFDAATIQRWLKHFEVFLTEIVRDASQSLARIDILGAEERQRLLGHGNPTRNLQAQKQPSGVPLVHRLFEDQVLRSPAAPAVVASEVSLNYDELNQRANRLAHYLREHGVGLGDLVGVCLERTADLVVALLAVLKAGGAYLPLDPGYPQDRMAFMLEDALAKVLVTEEALVLTSPPAGTTSIILDRHRVEIETRPATDLEPVATPADLAYVIYTSGSTGKPKGVQVTHANVCRLFSATNAWFAFGPRDVWTLFHSYAFDFSVWEIWGALLYGGRLVVVPYWVSRDPAAFRKLLVDERVTVLNQTPSAFRQLIQADLTEAPASYALRTVIFGGEALELHTLKPWFERYGDQQPRLVNMYGITETTVHVTYRPITQADVEAGLGSVIGAPIPDLYLRLLDARGEPVPVGVPGEIWVGGAGVARGYLNRPELTAERFVTDPFDASGQSRLYRSGDLARRLANGDLEFLGRIDAQVKIRGFRIELGEIEAGLSSHPAVRQSAVITREIGPGDVRIIAYVVAHDSEDLTVSDLRMHLRSLLPEYMLPSFVLTVPELPLTSNGKLDRAALFDPFRSLTPEAAASDPPAPGMEQTLADIWRTELKVDNINAGDNFFEIGGHSLLAVRVALALEEKTGWRMNPRVLFFQTLRQVAASAEAAALQSVGEGSA